MPLFRCIYLLYIFFFNLALCLFLKVTFSIYLFSYTLFVFLFFFFFSGGGGGGGRLGVTPLFRSIFFCGGIFLTDLIWGIAARCIQNI